MVSFSKHGRFSLQQVQFSDKSDQFLEAWTILQASVVNNQSGVELSEITAEPFSMAYLRRFCFTSIRPPRIFVLDVTARFPSVLLYARVLLLFVSRQ